MTRLRLLPLALAVTALLAVVAVAARGRPLGSGGGTSGGLPGSFWDYVFTTLVILGLLLAAVSFAVIRRFRRDPRERESMQRRSIRSLAYLLAALALATVLARYGVLQRLIHLHRHATTPPAPTLPGGHGKHHRVAVAPRPVHFRWDEFAIVLGLLLVLGVLATATRLGLGPATQRRREAPEVLAAALDESLDDLRADADLRGAIVAAYARMETALAATGLPRQPAEAPLEYLERALLTLDTSAGAVRRLTDLFEWARFSQHEPEPSMRDDAVDALVEVRNELCDSERIAA